MSYKALDYKKGGFKISGPCKSAAKRKFDVYPSAYANAWGVRCTKAVGPGSMGKSKKKHGGEIVYRPTKIYQSYSADLLTSIDASFFELNGKLTNKVRVSVKFDLEAFLQFCGTNSGCQYPKMIGYYLPNSIRRR